MKPGWLALIAFFLVTYVAIPVNAADSDVERHCIGLLWCSERSADGTSVDGLLWLYSSEERGSYSRLAIRPLYYMEEDPTRDLLRRSILWPFGNYERVGTSVSSHLIPLYWHGEDPSRRYTVLPPLYLDYTKGDHSYTTLLLLYHHHAQGSHYHQRFFVGPLLISTEDTSRDLSRWDVLFPLAGHSSSFDGADTWLAPVYFAGYHESTGRHYRFVLPLYGQSESPDSRFTFLFPLFGTAQDDTAQLHRLSLLGLPPIERLRTIPTFALYEHVTTPNLTSDRFFPLYRYIADDAEGTLVDVLLAYHHRSSASTTVDRLFPLYNIEDNQAQPARDISIVGLREWSLFRYASDPSRWGHRLLGLYGYSHDEQLDSSTVDVVGHGDFSLFRYQRSPSSLAHRLFPLYRYRYALVGDKTQFDALFLYRHLTTHTQTADRLLPMWDYESARDKDDWQISLLGLAPLTLIHHRSSDEVTANHFFPIYGYRDSETDGTSFSLVGLPPSPTFTWAWYAQKRTPSLMAMRLFPIVKYEEVFSNQSRQFSLVGIDPITLFRYRTSPDQTAHHLFSLYGYQRDSESWRFSALGLPPLGGSSTFSLFEVTDGPDRSAHRFTPVYVYAHDHTKAEVSANALYVYWYWSTKQASQHSAIPLGSFRLDDSRQEMGFTLFGLDPVVPASLLRHSTSPDAARSLLFPLYDYRREGIDRSLSLGGALEFSLFHRQVNDTLTRHRLFPIYDYRHDLSQDAAQTSVLLLYEREQSPTYASDRLLPLWQYEQWRDQDESRVNALGIGNISLYEHHAKKTGTTDRFFPLYRYTSIRDKDEAELSLLWPLVEYRSRQGAVTSASLLWWLASYEHPEADHSAFYLLGGSKMAMVRRMTSPRESVFEFNPVLPLYRYQHETEQGTSWDLFGGLVGIDSSKEQSRVKLLWFISL
jgi:hypothetical protein